MTGERTRLLRGQHQDAGEGLAAQREEQREQDGRGTEERHVAYGTLQQPSRSEGDASPPSAGRYGQRARRSSTWSMRRRLCGGAGSSSNTCKLRRRRKIVVGIVITTIASIVIGIVLFLVFSRSYTAGILLQLLSSLSSLSTCSTCFSLLVPIRQLALLGDHAFTSTFTNICIDLRIQPEDVCRGALERQGPIIAQSLRQIQPNKRTAAAFCRKMFGLCSGRGESVQDWPSEMFPAPHITRPPRKRRSGPVKTRKLVHISDLHIDPAYKTGAEAACGRVLCCRASSNPPLSSITQFKSPAGPFGNPHCDTPYSLFTSMLHHVNEVAGDAVAVISTGDMTSHAVWEETKESTSRDILEAYAIMRSAFKMPVIATIGNHDITPVNLFPPSYNRKAFQESQWVYDVHYNAWKDWMNSSQTNRSIFVDQVGCYSVEEPDMRLRFISLNTNFWSPDNFYLYDTEYQSPDPEGILAFLIAELQAAEAIGQRAIILGHAAPRLAFPAQSHYFDQVVQRYRSTVVAQLYGHTHSGDITISYSTPARKTAETASSLALTGAAVTPFGGLVNPGYRVYEIDEATGEIWDYREYFVNITELGPGTQGPLPWKLLHSAREDYGTLVDPPLESTSPLVPAFWHRLSEVFETSETAFRRYVFNKYRGTGFAAHRACRSERCQRYAICKMRRSRSEEPCSYEEIKGSESRAFGSPRPTHLRAYTAEEDEDGAPHLFKNAFGLRELLQGMQARLKEVERDDISVLSRRVAHAVK